MKIQSLFIISLCAIVSFVSCDDNTESFDEQWKLDNEAQFARITANSEYTRINSESTAGYIMYKEIESGNGETPYFTDNVRVLYTGWYKIDWSLPDTYEDNQEETVINKYIFDSTADRNNIPSTYTVSGLIDGYRTALQHMQVGDKWEIWIPWNLAYGATGNSSGSIPAYTTLVFEVELVGIVK